MLKYTYAKMGEKEANMQIRKTEKEDIKRVMALYKSAQQFMRENGNPTQWGTEYPWEELVLSDIDEGLSYVCVDEEEIVGVFYFKIGVDEVYNGLYDGEWLDDKECGVVHRIASGKKGVGGFCLDWCFEKYPNIKIDTHADNIPMQKLLEKKGFCYCGKIYMEGYGERIAFQKNK